MSGTRLHPFREGDRSEYLALYILSAFGLVTQVPRQEDIGFDFVCSIADQEEGNLTFKYQYLVTCKSASSPNIELKPAKSWSGKHPLPHLDWLFELDLPLLMAVVDKEKQTLSLYTMGAAWFVLFKYIHEAGSISLVPRVNSTNVEVEVYPKECGPLEDFPGFKHFEVDIGHPMHVITVDDIADKKRVYAIKERMREVIRCLELSIRFYKMKVPYFYWYGHTTPDCSEYNVSFYCRSLSGLEELKESILWEIAPILVTLAIHHRDRKELKELKVVGEMLKLIPSRFIPELIKTNLADVLR